MKPKNTSAKGVGFLSSIFTYRFHEAKEITQTDPFQIAGRIKSVEAGREGHMTLVQDTIG